jgi:hypothetical protein
MAGLNPLPSPRHGGPIGAGTFALVFVCFPVLWSTRSVRFRIAAVGSLVLFIAGGFVLSNPTRFGSSIEGLGQRLLALGALTPIAAVALATDAQMRSKRRSRMERPAAKPLRS